MRKIVPALTLLAACVFASACSPQVQADPVEPSHTTPAPMAPDFQGIGQWLNSPALHMPQLRGKVVLVEFWTYSCINCIHVLPHVKQWHADYRDQGLMVVGVHTPEFAYEKQTANLQAAVRRFGITYPVAQDNDYRTWNAYGNQYWPALYLIDVDGRVVYQHFGEGDYAQTEAKIRQLLAARRDDAPVAAAH
jgi:thiol-disulfide isomerase/thioredoxin